MYPTDPDIASRNLGMVILFVSYYNIRGALDEDGMKKFYMWNVHTRASVIFFLIVFTIFKLASPWLIVFGIIDFVGAIWTYLALYKDKG